MPRKQYKKLIVGMLSTMAMLTTMTGQVHAAGTAAGTNIANTAQVTYSVGGITLPKTSSNTINTKVSQVTSVAISSTNAPVVTPSQADVAASFTVTNTGNGFDKFNLTSNSTIAAGDQFDPTLKATNSIFLDVNGNGTFEAGTDTVATATAVLAANASAKYLVVNTIPNSTVVADTNTGKTELIATSTAQAGVAGTKAANAGLDINGVIIAGLDAVAGAGGGAGTGTGVYTVSSVINNPGTPGTGPFTKGKIPGTGGQPGTYNQGEYLKLSTVTDPYGGASPIPGATITYTLIFSVSGTGTAGNVLISDDIPANTTFVAGSIKRDNDGAGANLLTTIADTTIQTGAIAAFTAAPAGANNTGVVSVFLGNMTNATAIQVVTFDVTID